MRIIKIFQFHMNSSNIILQKCNECVMSHLVIDVGAVHIWFWSDHSLLILAGMFIYIYRLHYFDKIYANQFTEYINWLIIQRLTTRFKISKTPTMDSIYYIITLRFLLALLMGLPLFKNLKSFSDQMITSLQFLNFKGNTYVLMNVKS